MGALAILMLLHLAMTPGGCSPAGHDQKPWLGAALPALETWRGGSRGSGRYVGLGDAVGSLAGDHDGRCLLGTILGATATSRPPRRISWAATFMIGPVPGRSGHRYVRGDQQDRRDADLVPLVGGAGCGLWILLYLLMDVAGWRAWSIVVRPAGANPLVAYFLHPIVLGLVPSLAGLRGDAARVTRASHDPWVVVLGSLGDGVFRLCRDGLARSARSCGLRLDGPQPLGDKNPSRAVGSGDTHRRG